MSSKLIVNTIENTTGTHTINLDSGNSSIVGNLTVGGNLDLSSGGVYLGGTGSANKLDDYEEGTWTPSISTGTATFDKSAYVKVGNLVHLHTDVSAVSDQSSNSPFTIEGLPFTAVSDRAMNTGFMCAYGPASPVTSAYTSDGTNIRFYYTSAGVYDVVDHNYLQNSSFSAYVSVMYYTPI